MDPMIRINLLDWRDARRDLRQRRFITALGAAALGSAAVLFLVLTAYGNAINRQQARNRFLTRQSAVIDKQIAQIETLEKTRDDLIARMHIIEQLRQSRAKMVPYFDQIAATLPRGVYLLSLQQNGDTTTVEGLARSNARVSAYMTNLAGSDWFADPRLVVIQSNNANSRHVADFTLNFRAAVPAAKKQFGSGDRQATQ